MPAPSLTYTLTNGTAADASQVMQNFNDLLNGITDATKNLSVSSLTIAGVLTTPGTGIVMSGSSSGAGTFKAPAAAAAYVWTLPAATGTLAYTGNKLDAFAATTSAELRSVLSDETGTGAAFFAGGNFGAATGTTLALSDTTDTSSTSTGALQVAGGIAAVKKIMAGDGVILDGDTAAGGASTLNYYREADFTTTWTWNGSGGTSASLTCKITRIGRKILFSGVAITATTGTSSSFLQSGTSLPAWASSSAAPVIPIQISDNGTTAIGLLNVSGVSLSIGKVNSGTFTNSTTGGAPNAFTASWYI